MDMGTRNPAAHPVYVTSAHIPDGDRLSFWEQTCFDKMHAPMQQREVYHSPEKIIDFVQTKAEEQRVRSARHVKFDRL
jgi:hypothetical protein